MFTRRWLLGQVVLWPAGLLVGVLLGAELWCVVECGSKVVRVLVRSLIGG